MKPDTRQPWTHLGQTITPQGLTPTTQPIRFRSRYQSRWWRIDFTDGTWVNVGTKTDAIRYIESLDSRNTPGLDWKSVKRYLRTIAGI